VVEIGIVGILLNRSADELDGRLMVLHLVSQHAEQVKRIGVSRVGGEDLAIQRLGVLQPPCLVMMQGFLQRAIRVHRGYYERGAGKAFRFVLWAASDGTMPPSATAPVNETAR